MKVDKSEMTHKNPELRAGSVVKAKESSPKPKSTPTYGKTVAADKPSRFELDGGLIVHTKFYMPLENHPVFFTQYIVLHSWK